MTQNVSGSLAGLCSLAALVSIGAVIAGYQLVGAAVAISMLGLLSLAFQSPVGPEVLFEPLSKDLIAGVGRDE